jgi:hypothetical protein
MQFRIHKSDICYVEVLYLNRNKRQIRGSKMSEKKTINRTVAITLGIICILLTVGLVGAIADYTSIINGKNNDISTRDSQIQTLTNQNNQLRTWLIGNGTLKGNVTVINWPISHYVCVWWRHYIGPSSTILTSTYNASGFGHLHVLVDAESLSGSVTVYFDAAFYNQTRSALVAIPYYTYVLTPSNSYAAITVDVPNEIFYFAASTGASASCDISLSFYLTWA